MLRSDTPTQIRPDPGAEVYWVGLRRRSDDIRSLTCLLGKELVAAPADEPRQVLNLLDALKASVAQGASPADNGAAHDALAKQLSRPRGRRKATGKKPASRRPRRKTA